MCTGLPSMYTGCTVECSCDAPQLAAFDINSAVVDWAVAVQFVALVVPTAPGKNVVERAVPGHGLFCVGDVVVVSLFDFSSGGVCCTLLKSGEELTDDLWLTPTPSVVS